jgi:hypothetical protein
MVAHKAAMTSPGRSTGSCKKPPGPIIQPRPAGG